MCLRISAGPRTCPRDQSVSRFPSPLYSPTDFAGIRALYEQAPYDPCQPAATNLRRPRGAFATEGSAGFLRHHDASESSPVAAESSLSYQHVRQAGTSDYYDERKRVQSRKDHAEEPKEPKTVRFDTEPDEVVTLGGEGEMTPATPLRTGGPILNPIYDASGEMDVWQEGDADKTAVRIVAAATERIVARVARAEAREFSFYPEPPEEGRGGRSRSEGFRVHHRRGDEAGSSPSAEDEGRGGSEGTFNISAGSSTWGVQHRRRTRGVRRGDEAGSSTSAEDEDEGSGVDLDGVVVAEGGCVVAEGAPAQDPASNYFLPRGGRRSWADEMASSVVDPRGVWGPTTPHKPQLNMSAPAQHVGGHQHVGPPEQDENQHVGRPSERRRSIQPRCRTSPVQDRSEFLLGPSLATHLQGGVELLDGGNTSNTSNIAPKKFEKTQPRETESYTTSWSHGGDPGGSCHGGDHGGVSVLRETQKNEDVQNPAALATVSEAYVRGSDRKKSSLIPVMTNPVYGPTCHGTSGEASERQRRRRAQSEADLIRKTDRNRPSGSARAGGSSATGGSSYYMRRATSPRFSEGDHWTSPPSEKRGPAHWTRSRTTSAMSSLSPKKFLNNREGSHRAGSSDSDSLPPPPPGGARASSRPAGGSSGSDSLPPPPPAGGSVSSSATGSVPSSRSRGPAASSASGDRDAGDPRRDRRSGASSRSSYSGRSIYSEERYDSEERRAPESAVLSGASIPRSVGSRSEYSARSSVRSSARSGSRSSAKSAGAPASGSSSSLASRRGKGESSSLSRRSDDSSPDSRLSAEQTTSRTARASSGKQTTGDRSLKANTDLDRGAEGIGAIDEKHNAAAGGAMQTVPEHPLPDQAPLGERVFGDRLIGEFRGSAAGGPWVQDPDPPPLQKKRDYNGKWLIYELTPEYAAETFDELRNGLLNVLMAGDLTDKEVAIRYKVLRRRFKELKAELIDRIEELYYVVGMS